MRTVTGPARRVVVVGAGPGPRDLLNGNLLRLAAHGAFGRLQGRIERFFRDPRTRRVFSFQAMYAGLAPHRALAIAAGRVTGATGAR